MFHETLEEIEAEIFGEDYSFAYPAALADSTAGDRETADTKTTRNPNARGTYRQLGEMLGPNGGFHINRGCASRKNEGPESPYRIAYKRRHDADTQKALIKDALLAGEWPRVYSTPTRWFVVAAELGIDLVARSDPKFSAHWNKDGKR